MDFREFINNTRFVILDGAMGTMLQKAGLKLGERPELLNLTNGDLIKDVHYMYLKAGSNVVYTNTFGGNRHKLESSGHTVSEIVESAVGIGKSAIKKYEDETNNLGRSFVALDIGPIGELLEPNGTLSFEEAYDIFAEQMIVGEKSGADLIVIETMTDLYELKAAILAAKENTSLPIITTMTFEKNFRTFTGCSLESFCYTASSLGVDALGINCSLGPDEIYPMAEVLSRICPIPLVVKANAGLPNLETGGYDIDADLYSEYAEKIAKLGVKYIGGCCGTTPEFIEKIKICLDRLDDTKLIGQDLFNDRLSCVCSATKFVDINSIKVVGERINPTGKKRFKQALLENDIDYILSQVIEQVDGGADLLDINVGLPGLDEASMMQRVVKEIQSVSDIPLQIDSSNVDALEAGLRVYNGKPIINSVNGKKESMDQVLPLCKKYGAGIVALALDEDGIPKTAQGRFEVCEKILNEALKYGIPKEDIYVDCLTLTVSAEQEGCVQTLNAIRMVKEKLGLKTILGVSNISFGLPNRELINSTFLAMAMEKGLDLAIINPNIDIMMDTVSAFRVLHNIDKDACDYVERFHDFEIRKKSMNSNGGNGGNGSAPSGDNFLGKGSDSLNSRASGNEKSKLTIEDAIGRGLKDDTKRLAEEMLENINELELINNHLIPALDMVGDRYENGEIFLPQLIKAATASQEAFELIKLRIAKNDSESVSKGKIVMATVKGDIHDIGKNIVKVILENYGYQVIDLGRDVDIEKVVEAVVENDVKLVGLSALMTTTLQSMEDTIKRLREVTNDCKIMVGGAVLTEDYAMKMGADYYCKDAKKSVECAKIVYKN